MTLIDEIKSLAAEIELMVERVELQKSAAQPGLRHLLHQAQSEAESVMGLPAGALLPQPGGGAKPPSS